MALKTCRRLLPRLAVLVTSLVLSRTACAADFYAGKTITIVVATDETGGFSIYSRLIGNYLGRHIPGSPTVIVRNMPGAGGSTAAVSMTQQAPRDGTVIASLTPNPIMDRLFGRKISFDPTAFGYVGGAERGTRLCILSSQSKVKSLQDALKQDVVIGATQAGSPTTDYANFLERATGAKFKVVKGYSGPGALYLAMQRGEIDGMCGLDWAALKAQAPDALRDKKINIIVQFDEKPDPELEALGVPQPWRFIHDDLNRKAVKLMVNFEQAFGKAYVTPPAIPVERLAVLRRAFSDVLRDPQFLREAEKLRIDIAAVSGPEVEQTVRNLYQASPAIVQRLKDLTADASGR